MDSAKKVFFCTVLLTCAIYAAGEDADTTYVKNITDIEFKEVIEKNVVSIVYFSKKELPDTKKFLKNYESAAKSLTSYGVTLYLVDCKKFYVKPYCNRQKIESMVFAFKNGEEMIDMNVDTMFGEDPIMSNVLQLVLIKEVPIFVDSVERNLFEKKHKGKSDVIFGYHKAIGTHAHRIFMEVAFAYKDKFKFAISTEKPAVNGLKVEQDVLDGDPAWMVWMLKCKEVQNSETPCQNYAYKDTIDIVALSGFLKASEPQIHYIPEKGTDNIFYDRLMHSAVIFYNEIWRAFAENLVNELTTEYYGVLGVIAFNVESVDHEDTRLKFRLDGKNNKVPGFSIMLRGEEEPEFFQGDAFTNEAIFRFVQEKMSALTKENESEITDEEEFALEEELKQDDAVAGAVYNLRLKTYDTSNITDLDDKTFYSAVSDKSNLMMVLFYLEVDSTSMAFMRSYAEASEYLDAGRLARVSCYDWTDVCAKENVVKYPTVRIYKRGNKVEDYSGMLDGDAVVSTLKMYEVDSPVLLASMEDAVKFTDGHEPECNSAACVVGLFNSAKEAEPFIESSKSFLGKIIFGYTLGDTAKKLAQTFKPAKVPMVVVIKKHDEYQKHAILDNNFTKDIITEFVKKNSRFVLPELTMYNFPAMREENFIFVILFGNEEVEGEKTQAMKHVLADIAKSGEYSHLTFARMKLGYNSIANEILFTYDKEPTIPALIYIDFETGQIHSHKEIDSSKDNISTWLKKITDGSLPPTGTLPETEFMPKTPGYDFKKAIFSDIERKKREKLIKKRVEAELEAEEDAMAYEKTVPTEGTPVDPIPAPVQTTTPEKIEDVEEKEEDTDDLKKSRIYHKAEKKSENIHQKHTEL